MCIQQQKALEKNIEFNVKFVNIKENDLELHSPIICCDEHRVMQVLLGLQSNALKFT